MTKDVGLDDILKELGPFGRYNIVNYALLLFPIYLAGMYGSVFVFEAPDIKYRCNISECENLNHSNWMEYAIPKEKGEISKCKRFQFRVNITDGVCNKNEFNTSIEEDCSTFVYSDEDSAVKDFELACVDWKRTLIGSIHNAGLFIALPLTGFISDKYGRKIALALASLMNGVFGVLRSFSSSYIMMLIFEFLETALGGGVNSTAFVFAMELVHPKGRVLGINILNGVSVLGAITLSGLAWKLQNWRVLIRVIYAPAILAISYIWILNESPRWLLSKGRHNEAAEIIQKAAKMNKVRLSDEVLSPLYKDETLTEYNDEQFASPVSEEKRTSNFTRAIKSSIIRNRVIVCSFLWITCTFVYYGLAINSVSLAGNKYVNFILVAFVEIPSNFVALLVLDRFGRKKVLISTYVLSACMCIGLSFVPKDLKWLSLVFYLCGKCTITVAYFTVYIYVSEVFPTNVRQSLLAVCSSVGRVGSILAPLTPLLHVPSVFFGSLVLAASVLVLFLPETKNMPLPDTIEDAERLSQNKSRRVAQIGES